MLICLLSFSIILLFRKEIYPIFLIGHCGVRCSLHICGFSPFISSFWRPSTGNGTIIMKGRLFSERRRTGGASISPRKRVKGEGQQKGSRSEKKVGGRGSYSRKIGCTHGGKLELFLWRKRRIDKDGKSSWLRKRSTWGHVKSVASYDTHPAWWGLYSSPHPSNLKVFFKRRSVK